MADEIRQVLGFDVNDALLNLGRFDAGLTTTQKNLLDFGRSLGTFNTQVSGFTGTLNKGTGALNSYTSALNAAAGGVNTNLTNAGQAANQLNNAINNAQRGTGRLTTSFELMSRIIYTQLVIRGMRTFQRELGEAIKRAGELEVKFAQIRTIGGRDFSTFDQIQQGVEGLARFSGIDQLEVAEGLYQSISNQIKGTREELLEFSRISAEFAVSTGTKLKDSVDLLSGAMNSFGVGVQRADEFASKFFVTLELGRVLGPELATAFGRVDTQAAQLGVTFDELNAAFQTITVTGVKASEAATLIRGIFQGLTKPTVALRQVLSDLNVPSAQFLIQAEGLQGALQKIIAQTDGSAQSLAKLFPNVRGLNGLLITGIDRADEFAANLEKTRATANTLLKEKFQLVIETDALKVQRELRELDIELTHLGQDFISAAADTLDYVGGMETLIQTVKLATPVVIGFAGQMLLLRLQTDAAAASSLGLTKVLGGFARFGPALLAIGVAVSAASFALDRLEKDSLKSIKSTEAAHARATEEFVKLNRDRVRAVVEADEEILRSAAKTALGQYTAFAQAQQRIEGEQRVFTVGITNQLNRLLDVRKRQVSELQRAAEDSANAVVESQQQVANLRRGADDRDFQRRLSLIEDETGKFSALLARADQQSRQAGKLLANATNPREIEEARNLFEASQRTAESATAIAQRVRDRQLESIAAGRVEAITKRQIGAEQQLQRLKAAGVEQDISRVEQAKAITDRLEANVKTITENLTFVGKSEADAQEQMAKVQQAFKAIQEDAFSGGDVSLADALGLTRLASDIQRSLGQEVKLNFDAQAGIKSIQTQLDTAFSQYVVNIGVDVPKLEALLGRPIERTADAIQKAQQDASKQRQTLIEEEASAQNTLNAATADFDQRFGQQIQRLASTSNDLGRRFEILKDVTNPLTALAGQTGAVATNIGNDVRTLELVARELIALKDFNILPPDRTAAVLDLIKQVKESNGDVFRQDIDALSQAATLLQQRSDAFALQSEARQQRIRDLTTDTGLSAESALIRGGDYIKKSIESGADSLIQKLDARVLRQYTGGVVYRAAGGLARGVDTQPAMLQRGESIVNQGATQKWYSDIQRMNADMEPLYRSEGGTTNITVGDVNIQGTPGKNLNGRDIARALDREIRKGTIKGTR